MEYPMSESADLWAIEIEEMKSAQIAASVREPLDVTVTDDDLGENVGGCYRGMTDGKHRIFLRGDLRPADANWTLLHELAHCRQGERRGDDWASSVEQYRVTDEAEANVIAAALVRHFQVVDKTHPTRKETNDY